METEEEEEVEVSSSSSSSSDVISGALSMIIVVTWGQFYQHVYAQLLRVWIPKQRRKLDNDLTVIFSTFVKASRKNVDEIVT